MAVGASTVNVIVEVTTVVEASDGLGVTVVWKHDTESWLADEGPSCALLAKTVSRQLSWLHAPRSCREPGRAEPSAAWARSPKKEELLITANFLYRTTTAQK